MDPSTPSGLAALLPFWILIAGAIVVGASSWLDPRVRSADTRRTRDDAPPGPAGHGGYRPNDVDPMR